MSDMNIRNVPEELVKGCKKAALEAGVSLREWCIESLGMFLEQGTVETPKAQERAPKVRKSKEVNDAPATNEEACDAEIEALAESRGFSQVTIPSQAPDTSTKKGWLEKWGSRCPHRFGSRCEDCGKVFARLK